MFQRKIKAFDNTSLKGILLNIFNVIFYLFRSHHPAKYNYFIRRINLKQKK